MLATWELLESSPAFVAPTDYHRRVCLSDSPGVYIPSSMTIQSRTRFTKTTDHSPILPGRLTNNENACFLNACCITLANTPSLKRQFKELHASCAIKNCPVCSFLKLCSHLSAPERVTLAKSSFGKLLEAHATAKGYDFTGKRPGDSGRVLQHVLDWLITSELSSHLALQRKKLRIEKREDKLVYEIDDEVTKLTTIFGRCFNFVVKATKTCETCEQSSDHNETWRMIPIYPKENGESLGSLVNTRFDDQRVANYKECDRCHRQQCDMQFSCSIVASSPYIILQVIRSPSARDADIGEPTDVFELVSESLGLLKYQVWGAICFNDAHYYSLISSDKAWYRVSDEKVDSVKSGKAARLLSREAMFLFCRLAEGESHFFDQQEQPPESIRYESLPVDTPLVEAMRVVNIHEQTVTGIGIDEPLYLDLLVKDKT